MFWLFFNDLNFQYMEGCGFLDSRPRCRTIYYRIFASIFSDRAPFTEEFN